MLFVVFFIPSVFAVTNINSCTQLNVTNEVYNITGNIAHANSTCLNISANNITIQGNGFNLSRNNLSSAIQIYSDGSLGIRDDIVIRNINFYNTTIACSTGVGEICGGTNTTIRDSTFDIDVQSAGTVNVIDIRGTTDCLITNTTFTIEQGGLSAIILRGDSGVSGCNVTSNRFNDESPFGSVTIFDITGINNIFNNAFNHTGVMTFTTSGSFYNRTKTCSTNIIGGNCTGGNFWRQNSCYDTDLGDGLCEVPLTVVGSDIDYLPLSNTRAGFFVAPTPANNTAITNGSTITLAFNYSISVIDSCSFNINGNTQSGTVIGNNNCQLNYTFGQTGPHLVIGTAVVGADSFTTNETRVICHQFCSSGGSGLTPEPSQIEVLLTSSAGASPDFANFIEDITGGLIKAQYRQCAVRKTGPVETFNCEYTGFLSLTFLDFFSVALIIFISLIAGIAIFVDKTSRAFIYRKTQGKIPIYLTGTLLMIGLLFISAIFVFTNNIALVTIGKAFTGGGL